MRSKSRIGNISGRIHSRCVFVDGVCHHRKRRRLLECLTPSSALDFRTNHHQQQQLTSSNDKEDVFPTEYSIYMYGGIKKRLMSRFRRLSVVYTSTKGIPQVNNHNVISPATHTSSSPHAQHTDLSRSFQEGDDDDDEVELDDNDQHSHSEHHQQPATEEASATSDSELSPHLQINFDDTNEKEYANLRHVAGHVLWCNRINGAKTLFIHGGVQDPNESMLEYRYSNHIFTYNLETRQLGEPEFNGTWEIPTGREGHTVHTNASLNKSWMFGGFDGKRYSRDIHIFDADTMTFSHCHPRPIHPNCTHYIPSARYYHASIFFNDCIYVFGGVEKSGLSSTKLMYVFDTKSCTWLPPLKVPQDVLPTGVCEHAMCVFKKHYAILHGGRYDGKKHQEKIYVIDLRTNQWILAKDEPPDSIRDRSGHSIIEVNDQLWVIGGNTSLTNHNDLSIIDVEIFCTKPQGNTEQQTAAVSASSEFDFSPRDGAVTKVPRNIVSASFEDLCHRIIQREGAHFRHEDNLAGKMYVISPCDHEDYFLRFASVNGPLQFSRILSKYSRLVLTHNGSGELILKNQRSSEKKSTYLTLSSAGAKCGRNIHHATPLKLLPEDQIDEHGNIKKDYRVSPIEIKKFTKYHIKMLDCSTYLTYQMTQTSAKSKKLNVNPQVTFGPEKRTLFYALPLKHRKIFVRSLSVGMYLKDGHNNIRFSKKPNFHTRLIWLMLELPSGVKQNYLRTFSGKFFCLEQGVLTLTQRSSAICVDHVQIKGRDSQVVTLSLPSSGYLGVRTDPHTKQPSMVILPRGDDDKIQNEGVYFEITEIT